MKGGQEDGGGWMKKIGGRKRERERNVKIG
jgi:hypothetical protein